MHADHIYMLTASLLLTASACKKKEESTSSAPTETATAEEPQDAAPPVEEVDAAPPIIEPAKDVDQLPGPVGHDINAKKTINEKNYREALTAAETEAASL